MGWVQMMPVHLQYCRTSLRVARGVGSNGDRSFKVQCLAIRSRQHHHRVVASCLVNATLHRSCMLWNSDLGLTKAVNPTKRNPLSALAPGGVLACMIAAHRMNLTFLRVLQVCRVLFVLLT